MRTHLRAMLTAVVAVTVALSPAPAGGRAEEAAPAAPPAAEGAAREPSALPEPGKLEALLFEGPAYLLLRGADARRQIAVTGKYASGQLRDLTDKVSLSASPAGVVRISPDGLATPEGDGTAVVEARLDTGDGTVVGRLELKVESFQTEVPINFPNQIVPIFTKHGCNGGGCHGKSGGQNGFSLSLLGFYPEDDHEYLVKDHRGRRVFAASPERSLILLKATNTVPHGGGLRIEPEGFEYRLIRRWMLQGLPYGNPTDPTVARIEVLPAERTMDRHAGQQLCVFAHYTDGTVEDVTRMAQFESNVKEMAEVSPAGTVRTLDLTGDVAVMVRYQGNVGVFRATIPLGVPVEGLPSERNFIDTLVFAKLKALGIPPSPVCDDAAFVRRLTLDLAGRMPTAEEARSFIADTDAAKRDKLIDRLLASGDHADYFANKWSAILRNKRLNGNYTRGTFAFHDWLREAFVRNMRYDEFARGILAATGDLSQHPPVAWYRSVSTVEQEVEDAAQLFLGLRIQCARCHHHPFERWSQDDYYGFAAFFSRVGRKTGSEGLGDEPRIFHNRGLASATNPRSGRTLKPAGLGSAPLEVPADRDPRLALVDWMRSTDNPYFAASLVNRYWKHMFGQGIVEPEDDMRVTNPPSHPELLAALAKKFVESGFDMKALLRTIAQSTTYQLSSLPNAYNLRDRQNYSRYYPKRLNAEVLYDAVNQITGAVAGFPGVPSNMRAVGLPDSGVNNYFLTVFGRPMGESSCECERSQEANLAQSLHLMNSSEIQGKIAAGNGRAARLASDKERNDKEKVGELYLWAYARQPEAEELQVALEHLSKRENKQQAYEDVVWALLNTKEFLFNH